jgi:hypothetical protein
MDEISATDSDVREVPSRTWEHPRELAVYSNSIRTKVRMVLAIAVWVGRDEIYDRKRAIESESSGVRKMDSRRSRKTTS